MSDERRGRKPRVSDEEILDVFRNSADPVLIASEIAEHVDISRRAVNYRLTNLEDEGILRSKQVGGRSTVWWLPGYTKT
ncbi:winged helix-turn-helix domain-containing protein [Natronorarus salvus]|uniref:winged helix-turn-helix domain-containing protein n=1 Tax=Natronorarus salvus TaxID=3117733 RepID=UPI002F269FB0